MKTSPLEIVLSYKKIKGEIPWCDQWQKHASLLMETESDAKSKCGLSMSKWKQQIWFIFWLWIANIDFIFSLLRAILSITLCNQWRIGFCERYYDFILWYLLKSFGIHCILSYS